MATSSDSSDSSTELSARRVASASLALLAAAALLLGVAYAIGGDPAISDNWVGLVVVVAFFAGLVGTFVALCLALVAGVRRGSWAGLWLPLLAFPVVVAVVVLLEAFVFE